VLQDIELRHLHTVIVLAEEMHFTRASLRLDIAQPCLRKRIQQIERSQGIGLFARDKRRIAEHTDAGQLISSQTLAPQTSAEATMTSLMVLHSEFRIRHLASHAGISSRMARMLQRR
jgi:DNA-binding transcriptional LysR family regulator